MWVLDELENRKNSNKIAITNRDQKVTYKELWDDSDVLAQWITESCISNSPIIIYGNKDVRIVKAMIAILKSGRAYVPIDITFPAERVKKIADLTSAELIFDFSGMQDVLVNEAFNAQVVGIEEFQTILETSSADPFDKSYWVAEENNCYILFTSGSTGEPKGVQITKKNILNFVEWFRQFAEVDGGAVLNQVSYSFDVSVIQIYLYMPLGITLHSVDKEMIGDFGQLFDSLKKSNISVWVSTPAFIEMCAVYDAFNNALLPSLKKIILAGEVLTKKLVKALWEKFPGVEVINGYGPTEGTVLLSACTITEGMVDDEQNELPIGYILKDGICKFDTSIKAQNSEYGKQSSEKGELIVSTKSLSTGYYKNPEATAKNFFTDETGRKWYRTGDVVYEQNGLLYYCGRKDFQIKLNGYRIELDDISENINKISEVSNNVVIPVFRDGRVAYIAAFIVLSQKIELSNAKTSIYLRKELAKYVPSYMVPKKMIVVDQFPLNANGKIDRKKLMEIYL